MIRRMSLSNQFDSANYPENEPESLVAGDRWAWKRSDLHSVYANTLYDLKYSCRREASTADEIEITAAASGSDYLIEVPAATTVPYTPGIYLWQAYIIRKSDTERVTLESGRFEVLPDRDLATTDPRGHARKTLDAIEAYLEDSNNLKAANYSIAGRSLQRIGIPDLLVLRDKYRSEVVAEETAERIRQGLSTKNKVRVRL